MKVTQLIAIMATLTATMAATSNWTPTVKGGTPQITSVTPITAYNRQIIIISGSGFGNTPPQLQPVGDGSIDTYACNVTTPSIAVHDNGGGSHNWAAGRETCSNFDLIGIYMRSWTDTRIVLGGLGTALGTSGQGTWNIAVGDPVAIALFGPNNASEVDYSLTVTTITDTFHTNPVVGAIVFNSTSYTNGQSGNFAYNNYTAIAIVPSGYSFIGWSVSGGISVNNASSNPTTAAVVGSGSLTANYVKIASKPLEPGLVVLSGLLTSSVLVLRRRRTK